MAEATQTEIKNRRAPWSPRKKNILVALVAAVVVPVLAVAGGHTFSYFGTKHIQGIQDRQDRQARWEEFVKKEARPYALYEVDFEGNKYGIVCCLEENKVFLKKSNGRYEMVREDSIIKGVGDALNMELGE